MLRPQMRDEIRALAEVEGASTMTGLINSHIQQSLDALTALAKYDECFTPDTILTVAANGVVTLPTALQHLDDRGIYFLVNGSVDLGDKYILNSYARWRTSDVGRASQYRMYGVDGAGAISRKLQLTPYDDIDIVNDRVMINYWRKLTWNIDTSEFPIPKLQETLILRVAARICKRTNSQLAAKHLRDAQGAYAALRASSPMQT